MSLDSKHNRIKKFNKLLTSFKDLRRKNPQKERIMKNVDELYKKYYAYKNDYDTDDELNGSKKKKFDYSLNLLRKQINSQN